MQEPQCRACFFAQLGVEIRQRLVQQQQLRADHQSASQRDPLLLAAGKLVDARFLQTTQLHLFRAAFTRWRISSARKFAHLQAECDISSNGQMREQRVVLKDKSNVASIRRIKSDVGICRIEFGRSLALQSRRSCAASSICHSLRDPEA